MSTSLFSVSEVKSFGSNPTISNFVVPLGDVFSPGLMFPSSLSVTVALLNNSSSVILPFIASSIVKYLSEAIMVGASSHIAYNVIVAPGVFSNPKADAISETGTYLFSL